MLRRYTAIKDNVITNAYQAGLKIRGTGSNMGVADSLEIFMLYAQESSTSNEKARTLIQFPVLTTDATSSIQLDRNNGKIPASGSVNFYLRLFNVVHGQTLPRNYTIVVSPVSQSWQEGIGIDMNGYKDLTYDGTGSNWNNARAHVTWSSACEGGAGSTNGDADGLGGGLTGGSYLSASWSGQPFTTYDEFNYTQYIGEYGTDNLEIDITGLVEAWIGGTAIRDQTYNNYGMGIMITSSQESGSRSYYTKKFSARDSEFVMKRPVIEARWNDSKKDHRGNFYISSSLLNSSDNLNTLWLYNYYRGQLTDLANPNGTVSGAIYVNVYTSASVTDTDSTLCAHGDSTISKADCIVTGGWNTTGIYSASFALNTTASVVYDRWWSGSSPDELSTAADTTVYHTGSFSTGKFDSSNVYPILQYVTTITNLRPEYWRGDVTRLRLFTRLKDWSPTIYSVASKEIKNDFVEDAYYRVYRIADNFDVIEYGTGSIKYTRLSYDATGSYFDLNTEIFESGYQYAVKFAYYVNGIYQEQSETFVFRVTEQ